MTTTSPTTQAQEILEAYSGITNTDPDTAIPNLLSDLRHLCRETGIDFEEQVALSREIWLDECNN